MYNTHTGELINITSSQSYIGIVRVDRRGNIYYVLGGLCEPNGIYLIDSKSFEEVCLYETGEGYYIGSMDLDVRNGVVYFSPVTYEELRTPPQESSSKLVRLVDGEVEVLAEVNGSIWDMVVSSNPTLGVFFTVTRISDYACILQYVNGEVRMVAERVTPYNPYFLYITLGKDGSLYWVYRERTDFEDVDQWGYLEVARIPLSRLKKGGEPEILYSQRFEDKGVYGWLRTDSFINVFGRNDLFFSMIYIYEEEGRIFENILYWLNVRDGVLTPM